MNIPQILLNKPALGAKLNLSHPLSKGLVGCWLFNEQTGLYAFDSSPYKNHGKLVNFNDPTSKDRSSLGLEFDGISKYINCGNDPTLNITDAITIETWVKTTVKQWGGIVSKYDGSNLDYWRLIETDTGKMYFSIHDGTTMSVIIGTTDITDGQWHRIVAVRDTSAGKLYLYVDGNSDKTPATDNTGDTEPTTNCCIGRYGGNYFNGSIDGVKIYNRALSGSEIILAYQHPYCMFQKR